jgi:hypothetical protein
MAAATNAFVLAGEHLEADPVALAHECGPDLVRGLFAGARYARARLAVEIAARRGLSAEHQALYDTLQAALTRDPAGALLRARR